MNRPRWWLVVPVLLASSVLNAASAAEIRDKANLFSPDAVKKAQAELDRLEKQYDVPVTIETIASLDGDKLADATIRHAEAVGAQGVYILIPKKEHDIEAVSSKHFRQYLPKSRMSAVANAFVKSFKSGDFDAGLNDGVSKLESVFTDAKADSGGTIRQSSPPNTRRGGVATPARRAPAAKPASGGFSLITLIIGVLVLLFVLRLLGGLFSAMRGGNQYGAGNMMGGRGGYPGGPMGGPGYGGGYGGAPAGGGGFMSSLFGGIGGAMAGNWIYDQFSGRQHGGGYGDQTGYDQSAGAAPIEDTSPEWSADNGASADWGGGGSTDVASNDWGGGAGGGGGDWGGGGGDAGGDWGSGGGDDNGASW